MRKNGWRRARDARRVAVCVNVRKSPLRGVVTTTMSKLVVDEEAMEEESEEDVDTDDEWAMVDE